MKNLSFRLTVIIAFCVVCWGCDSELLIEADDKIELEYEYVEVDLDLMARLNQISGENAFDGEPQIEFYHDQQPIKRFRSYDDFYISADLVAENSRLTGAPILIHASLQKYIEYKYLLPSEELAFVNYLGRLIIGDTLYTLADTYYKKQHLDDQVADIIGLPEFNPSQDLRDFLSEILEKHGVDRVSDAFDFKKNATYSGVQSGCGDPDDFGFVGGSDPTRSVSYTDMCVADFNYPSIRLNPSDYELTPNAPGAVVMWNTSYKTWTGARRGIANTRLFKYRVVNGSRSLDYARLYDLPRGQYTRVSVIVSTSKGRSSSYGTVSTWASHSRKRGRGTRSEHTAIVTGVANLPSGYRVN